jgi:Dolichyl-phosphate-mannose-protein mannosyltransferase
VKRVWLCWAFVSVLVTFGVIANTGIGGGSDSYGYVSQADLWLKGILRIEQPEARALPWPNGQFTLSPLGYRPSPDRSAIVPVYAPGLPMILAASKRAAGQCAIRWIVPLSGGLLLLATFGIGRVMFSDQIGLAASWLVFTSPAVLTMLAQPMSDIPVAACWAIATYGCLRGSLRGAALAGALAGTAILVRPNLVHLGFLMGIWIVAKDLRWRPLRLSPWRALLYAVPTISACVGVGLINRHLYGAATSSGYGDLNFLFDPGRGGANLLRYTRWLVESQTPVVLLGAIAVFLPARFLKNDREPASGRGLLAALCGGVVAAYLFWLVFDAWWYLRFLLSAWPAIFVTTAWLLAWPSGRTFTSLGTAAVLCLGLYGLWYAHHVGIFDLGEGDRRYVAAARLVNGATPANSLIISMQHSGTVRYYGSRMTLRYDYLEPRWLDPAVTWLVERGVHPYFLLDDWEVPEFQKRFAASELGKLNVARVFEYQSNPKVFLYDPLQRERAGEKTAVFTKDQVRVTSCPAPAAEPHLALK